jgi:ATP phosphoribosyltransferase regulatory subunit
MTHSNHWLLPEGIEDILPNEAATLESLRSDVLQLFGCWGYQLAIPPMVEFLDTLLTGSAHDLELETFKVIDQLSGRLMGIRADITPQIARIDARMHGDTDHPSRFCYLGTTLRTRGSHLERSRSPLQVGAELYGYANYQADVEVIRLMLELLALSGLTDVQFELGHIGIYQGLVSQAGLDAQQETLLFDILQRKAGAELAEFLKQCDISSAVQSMLLVLPDLCGDRAVIARARELLQNANNEVHQALDTLESIATGIHQHFPLLDIHFDLTELRGYHYKTGVVFAAFVPGFGREVARGGRYDGIGKTFGAARSATGFSADLKVLARLGRQLREQTKINAVVAPSIDDADLHVKIRDMRSNGRVVIEAMPNQHIEENSMGCVEKLVHRDGRWVVEPIQS